ILRSPEGRELMAMVLANARYFSEGLLKLGFKTLTGEPIRTDPASEHRERVVTPVIPIVIGDDWKAALLWRALYDEGLFTNCALHPAVAPGKALLRTSVMASHDRPVLDRALEILAAVKAAFEADHGPLPAPEDE